MSLIETFKLKRHAINHLAGLTMTEQFCTAKLHEFEQFVLQKRDSMLALLCFQLWPLLEISRVFALVYRSFTVQVQ